MKIFSEKTSKLLLFFGIMLLITGIVIFVWNETFTFNTKINSEKVSHFGDYVGGIIGSIWSLAGVILFYIALTEQREDIKINRNTLNIQVETLKQQIKEFELQREELSETRKVFKEQSETLKIQRFENTLFQLINLHHEIIDKLIFHNPIDNKISVKREVFTEFVKTLEELVCMNNKIKSIENGNIVYVSEPPKNMKQAYQNLIKAYSGFYFNYTNQLLSHYFRNIYHIFKFIHKTKLIKKENKQFYASLVRAQLASNELTLILYNSLVPGLGFPNFLFLIKKFDILQNYDFKIFNKFEFHKEIFNSKIKNVKPDFNL